MIKYIIPVALSTTNGLTGIGEEWIIDAVTGELIARFYNGNLTAQVTPPLSLATEGNIKSEDGLMSPSLFEGTTIVLKEAA
jgi:hypothetical protein